MKIFKVGTRGSALALKQTELIIGRMQRLYSSFNFEVIPISTRGDRNRDSAPVSSRDKKDWIYDLELALIGKEIDFAVHSSKDVPIDISEETELVPALERANPKDAIILRNSVETKGQSAEDIIMNLPKGSTIGTSSLRRKAMLSALRPKINIIPIRGNITTRIRNLDSSENLDAIVLAAAGLERIGLKKRINGEFSPREFIPAVNQGNLTIQFLKQREDLRNLFEKLSTEELRISWSAEREVIKELGADCESIVGVYCHKIDSELFEISCKVLSEDGKESILVRETFKAPEVIPISKQVAKSIIDQGGDKYL